MQKMSDPKCGFCHRGKETEKVCGTLHSVTSSVDGARVTAHHKCMQYSATLIQYTFDNFGGFKIGKVQAEMRRGRSLKCHICRKSKKKKCVPSGATSGCAIQKCSRSFHFFCARLDKEAITRRLVITDKEGKKSVLYRVFCSKKHQIEYDRKEINNIEYVSDSSDEDGDEEDGDLQDFSQSSNETPGSQSQPVEDSPLKCVKKLFKTPNVHSQGQELAHRAPHSGDGDAGSEKGRGGTVSKVKSQSKSHHNDTDSDATLDPNEDSDGRPSTPMSSVSSDDRRSTTQKSNMPSDNSPKSQHNGTPEREAVHKDGSDREDSRKRPLEDGSDKGGMKRWKPGSQSEVASPDQSPVAKCLSAEGEYALVLIEAGALDSDWSDRIQKLVHRHYGILEPNVYIWAYSVEEQLNPQQMLYLIKDVAKALRQENFHEVDRLLFELSEEDLERINHLIQYNSEYMDEDLRQKIENKLRENICNLFRESRESLGERLGGFHRIKSLDTNMAVLLLGDTVDPGGRMRSRMGNKLGMFEWTMTTMLKPLRSFSPSTQHEYRNHELNEVKLWLEKNLEPGFTAYARPVDELLLLDKPEDSITAHLRNYFIPKASESPSAVVLFIGPVVPDLLAFHHYCQRCVKSFVEEQLSALVDVYCVLDLDLFPAEAQVQDLVVGLGKHIDVHIWSGLNPSRHPTSCVILQFNMRTDNSGLKDSTKNNDVKMPSTLNYHLHPDVSKTLGVAMVSLGPSPPSAKSLNKNNQSQDSGYVEDGEKPSTSANPSTRKARHPRSKAA